MMAAVSRIAVAAGYYSVPATNTSARLPRPHPRYTGLTMSDIDPGTSTRAAARLQGTDSACGGQGDGRVRTEGEGEETRVVG